MPTRAILSPESGLWFLDLLIAPLADVHPGYPLVRNVEFQLSLRELSYICPDPER